MIEEFARAWHILWPILPILLLPFFILGMNALAKWAEKAPRESHRMPAE